MNKASTALTGVVMSGVARAGVALVTALVLVGCAGSAAFTAAGRAEPAADAAESPGPDVDSAADGADHASPDADLTEDAMGDDSGDWSVDDSAPADSTASAVPPASNGELGSAETAPPIPASYPPSLVADLEVVPGGVTVRPVIECRDDTRLRARVAEEVVLPYPAESKSCLLGPAYVAGKHIGRAEPTFDNTYAMWTIDLRIGREASVAWNQVAAMCYSAEPTCPSRQIAITFNDVVVVAPTTTDDRFDTGIQVSGDFTEAEARDIAEAINTNP